MIALFAPFTDSNERLIKSALAGVKTWIQTSSGVKPGTSISDLTKLKSVSEAAGKAASICLTPSYNCINRLNNTQLKK